MQKNVEKMSKNYSPNFDIKKRNNSKVKYLVFHYTGMKSENAAIKRLTNENSKVSCHYFIKNNGQIIRIVPDLYVAWHAGISSWKKDKFINSNSIGIEISNPGHNHGYKNFNQKQVSSIIYLSKKLKKKYKIKKENIWHSLSEKNCKKLRSIKLNDSKNFFQLLFKFGYKSTNNLHKRIKIYKNFQRRFRPQLISSIVDQESYSILKSLI